MRMHRLGTADVELAGETFRLMEEVFEETPVPLSTRYLQTLLGNPDFWAFVALDGDTPVGGITGHTLPMTRSESSELFIYDLAVHPDHQRHGVGRALVDALRAAAAMEGIQLAFVPADHDDEHALAFYRALGGDEARVSFFIFD